MVKINMAKKKTKLQGWRDSVIAGVWVNMQDAKKINQRLDNIEKTLKEIESAVQRLEVKP